LIFQGRRALDAGLLESRDLRKIERLCARLPEHVPVQRAALVHGDLWTGNLHACADGEEADADLYLSVLVILLQRTGDVRERTKTKRRVTDRERTRQ
jgi:hypothetical protein